MIARLPTLTLAAFIALGTVASAQTSTKTPQTAPNPSAAEANPSTVKGPGGYTTEPASASQSAPAKYGGDPNASGND
ncbi:MAG: hypothetical protein M3154_11395, partial [Candidatus Eremiobacteraeota bacterium]|nr:hypothetical protein [Candidatus Eremiobacteraeota bacterium]